MMVVKLGRTKFPTSRSMDHGVPEMWSPFHFNEQGGDDGQSRQSIEAATTNWGR